MKVWAMSPRIGKHDNCRRLGSGYTPKLRETFKNMEIPDKETGWFFAGQLNNKRRQDCAKWLKNYEKGEFIGTQGFTQGIDQEEYFKKLADAKIAPCPSGIHTPDTFRLFEALESGCIPIADEVCDEYIPEVGYWGWFFEEQVPFPVIRNYEGIQDYIRKLLPDWKNKGNKVFAWWMKKKREMAYNLRNDIKQLSGIDFEDNITVIIPTSTIPSHPSTEIIDQTISDVRKKLPNSEIILMFDGLNEHYADRKDVYEEYIRRTLWKCNFEWKNVLPLIFDEPSHQVKMTREALKYVKTPTILFVEQDAPICPDPEFDYSFNELVKTIESGQAQLVRFHHEASILESSKHLMIGNIEMVNGVPMQRTIQYSQRPHLASTAFYRNMLDFYFSKDCYTMIEDVIYGKVIEDYEKMGMQGWFQWRLWVFAPSITGEGNWKRSYTTDGRKEDKKYDEDFRK
jgi:hypothetical protein